MRGIPFIALAVALAGVAAARPGRAGDSVSFENKTCGPLTLAFASGVSCGAPGPGCQTAVEADRAREIALARPRPQLLDVKIEGRCAERTETRISGHCTVDLDRLFAARPAPPFFIWPTSILGGSYAFDFTQSPGESAAAPAPPGPATVDIAISDCEPSADGTRRVCTVACTH